MKETITETKVVEEEREVKICDYCKLVSEDDIDENEEFGEVMLNPTFQFNDNYIYEEHPMYKEIIEANNMADAYDVLHQWSWNEYDDTVDLCPYCTDDLFGDGPMSMIRDGVDP